MKVLVAALVVALAAWRGSEALPKQAPNALRQKPWSWPPPKPAASPPATPPADFGSRVSPGDFEPGLVAPEGDARPELAAPGDDTRLEAPEGDGGFSLVIPVGGDEELSPVAPRLGAPVGDEQFDPFTLFEGDAGLVTPAGDAELRLVIPGGSDADLEVLPPGGADAGVVSVFPDGDEQGLDAASPAGDDQGLDSALPGEDETSLLELEVPGGEGEDLQAAGSEANVVSKSPTGDTTQIDSRLGLAARRRSRRQRRRRKKSRARVPASAEVTVVLPGPAPFPEPPTFDTLSVALPAALSPQQPAVPALRPAPALAPQLPAVPALRPAPALAPQLPAAPAPRPAPALPPIPALPPQLASVPAPAPALPQQVPRHPCLRAPEA
ncbi:skin secretory protein xP2-like [Scylla paramamosain]|uniref:skin secretory protein xP2-like n=1 Tax=Scylla paramamosain TaxID=85552 RepID=UPI003082D13D